MECLKLKNLLKKHSHKKNALIYCSQNDIIKEVTFETVFHIANEVKLFLSKNIEDDNICIGLLMDKNVLIPSIIISFQDLRYSFIFLTTETLVDTASSLNIKWIASVDIKPTTENFSLIETLQFSTEGEILLWKNDTFLEDKKHQSYKDIFCVVQTSGSTGESKTVCVPHACIEQNVISLNKYFNILNNDVIYWGTPLTFDPTLIEFILGIAYGATLFIVPKLVALNPFFLYHALFKIGSTTFLQMVPSVFLRWSQQLISEILLNSSLKILAFGGESFPQEILNYRRNNELQLYNLYGVTELSCWATIADVSSYSLEKAAPLGDSLDETFIQLKSEDNKVVSSGIGEIWIGSHTRFCLMNDDIEMLESPFVVGTGDLGEWQDGTLFYRGRKTRVMKRFGHKVILHKIENTIFNETGLQSRLVYSVLRKKLLAFIIIEEYYNSNAKKRLLDKMRVKLQKVLPDHEFPDFLDILTHFPLNPHGKICDKSLHKRYEKFRTDILSKERNLRDIFIDTLTGYLKTELRGNIEHLGKLSFFELGGNSILAIQFLEMFKEQTGTDAFGELVTLLINDSIEACLNYVDQIITFKRSLSDDVKENRETKVLKVETTQWDCVLWKYNLKGCVDSAPLAFERSGKTFIASGSFAHKFAILYENCQEYLTLLLPQEVEAQPCVSKCGNFVFIGCTNGFMYSIDMTLKRIVWEHQTLQKIRSCAYLCGTCLVFGSYDGFFYCLAMEDGILQWKSDLLGSIRADPVYEEKLKIIYVGTTKGGCYALNATNGSVVWSYRIDGPIFGSPCVFRDYTIWPSVIGKLYCFSSTGDVKWTFKINGHIFSSLIMHRDAIYFACHDSYLYRIVPSDTECCASKIFKLESESSSSPFLYQYRDREFIISTCNIGILYVIDTSSNAVVFRMQLPAQSFSSPYVFNNRVYVGCRDDNLYCIDIEKALID